MPCLIFLASGIGSQQGLVCELLLLLYMQHQAHTEVSRSLQGRSNEKINTTKSYVNNSCGGRGNIVVTLKQLPSVAGCRRWYPEPLPHYVISNCLFSFSHCPPYLVTSQPFLLFCSCFFKRQRAGNRAEGNMDGARTVAITGNLLVQH